MNFKFVKVILAQVSTLIFPYFGKAFNPIHDRPLRGCSRMGREGARRPFSLKSVTYIHDDETWHCHTLPKEDPKNI